MAFTVLFVCTGNICRSPMAERLLQHRAGRGVPLTVSSAGTAALIGYPMDPPFAAQLSALGVDPSGHHARRLDAQLIAEADLVLTAAAAHRSDVLQAEPLAMRQTFTVREFGRLGASLSRIDGADDAALRDRVKAVAGLRGTVPAPEGQSDDITDPFGASAQIVEHSARQISDAIDAVVVALGVRRPSPR